MVTEGFKRKITAIMSADVVGYSKLMGNDEAATVQTLAVYKNVMSALIDQHRGRVIDSPGDNMLSEFASVVDAVQCAVAIQKELTCRNAELPEYRKMRFRIGINLGDVIQEKDRIYGDGVNIAARLEALADPGGICVSKTAFDHIETKLPLGYEFLGEQEVKNIEKPVGAYRVVMEPRVTVAELKKKIIPIWRRKAAIFGAIAALFVLIGAIAWKLHLRSLSIEPVSVEKMAFALPDKLSIAVLPFDNLSGDQEQEYFSDGLTDEIITTLSSVPKLFVIARNSSFTYKGKPVKVQQVSEELGVRHVLEGSVRKAGEKVRITAQLIDAITGRHLWAKQYDQNLEDIFAVQDEITKNIITAMQVNLTEGEQARAAAKGTNNFEAYLKYLQANAYLQRQGIGSVALARQLAEEAIPEYKIAIRLNPIPTSLYFWSLGLAYAETGQYEEGIAWCEKAIDREPDSLWARIMLTAVYGWSGRDEEARAEAAEVLRINPNFSLERFAVRASPELVAALLKAGLK